MYTCACPEEDPPVEFQTSLHTFPFHGLALQYMSFYMKSQCLKLQYKYSTSPGVDPGIFCRGGGGKLEKMGKNDLRGRRPRQKLMIFLMFLCIF